MTYNSGKYLFWLASFAMCLLLPRVGHAATLVYGFDDGTFGDWEYLNVDGDEFPDDSDVSWIASDEPININDGFTLLPATSGDYRIVPDPWANRDCLGGNTCYTQILRSPEFFLDGSGDLSIDMMGGGATSNVAFDPDLHFAPEEPEELPIFKESTALQGYALYEVESNRYVLHGFPSYENDGKARPDDPETRAGWETVSIPQDELVAFANNDKAYRVDVFDSYSGGWGWIGFDTVTIPGRSVDGGGGIPGDVNSDGAVNNVDMDELSEAVTGGDSDSRFDVNSDGAVNNADRVFWIDSINNSYFGDANLDGEFNSSDLVTVFSAGKYETGEAAGWAEGDWDGDMTFSSGDLVTAFQSGGYEQGPRAAVAAVPEPSSVVLLLIGLVAFLRRR